jgi:hypothetical protein
MIAENTSSEPMCGFWHGTGRDQPTGPRAWQPPAVQAEWRARAPSPACPARPGWTVVGAGAGQPISTWMGPVEIGSGVAWKVLPVASETLVPV